MNHKDVSRPEIVLFLLVQGYLHLGRRKCERKGLAVDIVKLIRTIQQSHVHTSTVRTVIMHNLEIGIRDFVLADEILKHEPVLNLADTKNGMIYAVILLHRANNMRHVEKFLLVFGFSPFVLAVRKELFVVLARLIIDIKKILQIIESDHIFLLLCESTDT